jgi:glycosyltransferase involved in cell wall biosynthesis
MMSHEGPAIAIIVAVFNGSATVQRCIDSVVGQTYPHKELIVIDGGSSDGTAEILKENSQKIAYWVSEPDRGIYQAWNKALAQTHGDWVCFLGADDYLWDAHVLERMAPHLSSALPAARVVYGQVALVNESGTVLNSFGKPWPELRPAFMRGDALNIHQAMFHHRSLFEDRGTFDESFRIAGDYDLLLRELREGRAEFVPCLVAGMQHGGVSSHPASKVTTIREVMRAMQCHGLKPPAGLRAAWLRAVAHAWLYRVAGGHVSGAVADGYRSLTGKSRLWTSTGK